MTRRCSRPSLPPRAHARSERHAGPHHREHVSSGALVPEIVRAGRPHEAGDENTSPGRCSWEPVASRNSAPCPRHHRPRETVTAPLPWYPRITPDPHAFCAPQPHAHGNLHPTPTANLLPGHPGDLPPHTPRRRFTSLPTVRPLLGGAGLSASVARTSMTCARAIRASRPLWRLKRQAVAGPHGSCRRRLFNCANDVDEMPRVRAGPSGVGADTRGMS